MLDGGRVVGVQDLRCDGKLCDGLSESAFLLLARPVGQLRRMELRARAFGWVRREHVAQRLDVAPRNARAVHPGVDHEVPGVGRAGPPLDALARPQYRAEAGAPRRVELRGEQRREHQDRVLEARPSQFLAFLDRGDAESPGEILECVGDTHGPQTVRVGLHHRQDGTPRRALEPLPIPHQRAEVDLDPGTRVQA